jgi:hypothetical protein
MSNSHLESKVHLGVLLGISLARDFTGQHAKLRTHRPAGKLFNVWPGDTRTGMHFIVWPYDYGKHFNVWPSDEVFNV